MIERGTERQAAGPGVMAAERKARQTLAIKAVREAETPLMVAMDAAAGRDAAASLGERVRTQRLLAGLSVEEAAGRAGISAGYYSEIERGRKSPSMRVLGCIAAALRLSPARLLEDVDPLPRLPALDPRRPLLARLFEVTASLDAGALRSLLDYAGYLSQTRATARRSSLAALPRPATAPLFPDDIPPRE